MNTFRDMRTRHSRLAVTQREVEGAERVREDGERKLAETHRKAGEAGEKEREELARRLAEVHSQNSFDFESSDNIHDCFDITVECFNIH